MTDDRNPHDSTHTPFHYKMRALRFNENLSNSFDSSAAWPNLIILIVYAKAPDGISVNFAD